VSRFVKLSFATAAATLVMIGLGGLVRATDSGLGCPDWPGCFGNVIPPDESHAWIEHTHRMWAVVLLGFIVALVVLARRDGQPRGVRRATWALVAVWWAQALLGAIVVWLKLHAASVSLHLTIALTILAVTVGLGVDGLRRERGAVSSPRATARLGVWTAGVTGVQMVLGSVVTGVGAGLAYATFPSFNGRAVPAFHPPYQWREATHVGHRLLAYTLAVLVVVLAVRARRRGDAWLARLSLLAVGLVAVQIVLGVLNLRWQLSAWSVVPHMLVGASLWATLVAYALAARWLAPVTEPAAIADADRVAVSA
jgi:cytochrome c oxidase assembly protein subunit 15